MTPALFIVVKEMAEAFAPALEVERIRMKKHTMYTGDPFIRNKFQGRPQSRKLCGLVLLKSKMRIWIQKRGYECREEISHSDMIYHYNIGLSDFAI